MKIASLQPPALWKNFIALNAVPRASKKEERVIAFVQRFGERLGLETQVDGTGNVLIRKPATAGMESRKKVILQSHLDMVHQKNNKVDFDFDSEGIRMYIDGDWVMAEGTTLGADNGIGVAAIMAILESTDIPHPPLEALFTIDEETGMTGAFGLQPGFLSGDILLNLDTEEDDEIDIGCAGGIDITARKQYSVEKSSEKGIQINVRGLQGGHSGMDIDKGRGNANVLLTRLLYAGLEDGIRLAYIDGGGLRNAIPREAEATIIPDHPVQFLEKAETLKNDILKEYHHIESNLQIDIKAVEVTDRCISSEESHRLILGLTAAHNGVFRMSPEVEGLVETSNNIARILLSDGDLKILCLSRSSVESTKMAIAQQLKSSFELAGLEVEFSGSYPGWQPNPDSEIISIMKNIYHRKFGEAPDVVACHAGLECGIIGSHYPDMEMVSFGPTIRGAHSPDEKVSIPSVAKFWDFLLEILREIPEGRREEG